MGNRDSERLSEPTVFKQLVCPDWDSACWFECSATLSDTRIHTQRYFILWVGLSRECVQAVIPLLSNNKNV